MEIFNKIIEFITDKTKSWSFKTALFISIITISFISDYYLGFSYNYHIEYKISHLKEIESLKNYYLDDSLSLKEIEKVKMNVLNKSHYSEFIDKILLKDNSPPKKPGKAIITDEIQNSNKKEETTKSRFWMVLSSNYSLIVITPILLLLPVLSKENRTTNDILGWFASLTIIVMIISITTWVSYQIPLINKNPLYNYLLNFLIHTSFLAFILLHFKRNKD